MKKKVIIGLASLLVLAAGIFGFYEMNGGKFSIHADTVSGQTFSDVPPDYWAYLQIEAAYRGNIVSGYADGTYKPETVVTRDQMAVFIARAIAGGDSKVPTGPSTASFSDVPTSNWAFKYIEFCKTKGIISAAINYNPTQVVTRDQMAVFIARAIAGSDSAVPAGPAAATFPDVPTSNWAYKYIEYLSGQGIVGGYPDGTYHPLEQITRAQMAAFVTNAYNLISTALVANISGKVTDSAGAPIANAYIVVDGYEDITQTDSDGNYTINDLDATTLEIEIYGENGNLYESPDISNHLISPNYGNNTINFSGLVKK